MSTTNSMTQRTVAVIAIALGIATVLTIGQRRVGSQAIEPSLPHELTLRGLGRFLDELGATDDQRAHLQTLIDTWGPVLTELTTEAERARTSLLETFEADQPDTARLHAVIDEQAAALRTVSHELLDDAVEFYSTLTAEQREIIRQYSERAPRVRRARWGGWWRR